MHSWARIHHDSTCKIDHESRVGFFFSTANQKSFKKKRVSTYRSSRQPPLPEFSLVSFDALGSPQPLPPGLGDLPLYLDNDGYCSVNGPRDFTALPLCSAIDPDSHDGSSMIKPSVTVISGLSDKKPSISASPSQPCLNDDAISRSVTFPSNLQAPTPFIILEYVHP